VPPISQNIQAQVPAGFASFLRDPAFSMQQATFCYWRRANDASWTKVSGALADDGSDGMLELLVSSASSYREWAEGYYEVPVSLDAVPAVFSHQSLDEAVIRTLNPGAIMSSTYIDAGEIGYPTHRKDR
jgi:hypothetical protein